MKYRNSKILVAVFFLLFVGALTLGCSVNRVAPVDAAPLAIPELNLEHWKLSNGITVYLLENHDLPIVSGSITFRGGSLLDAPKSPGVISAMGTEIRQGGSKLLSADAMDEELERLSADIGSGAGQETTAVTFSCLSGDLDRVFKMFSSVVQEPAFEQNKLTLWKDQALEGIRRRTDEPWTVGGIAFGQLVFGDTPYGRQARSADVKKINRSQLLAAYKEIVRPDGSYLAVSGGITKPELQKLLEQYFVNWPARGSIGNTIPPLNYTPKPGIYYIDLPLSQASVFIGQQGVPRLTPDYAAIDGFNQIFGSGFFGSRLMKKVRAELGLVYGIYGGIFAGPMKGKTFIAFQTKATTTAQAINESLGELIKLQQEPVPPQELAEMKRAVANGFVFKFDSIEAALNRKVTLDLLDYPADYDQQYIPTLQKLTSAQVQAVAQNRWDPSQLVIIVVGNEAAYESVLQLKKSPISAIAKMPITRLKFNETVVMK